MGVENKSASIWNRNFNKELKRFSEKNIYLAKNYVKYQGENMILNDVAEALSYKEVSRILRLP